MDGNRIAEFLKKLNRTRRRLTLEELEGLYRLASHSSASIRSNVAALLIDHYEEKSEQVLLALSYDPDHTVRANAADSLSIARGESALKRLLYLAEEDPMQIVRGYAVHSFYDVSVNLWGDSSATHKMVSGVLTPLLEQERNKWVQTCYYCVLYLCGRRSYLDPIIDCLDDEDYYIRNSVLTTFEDILDDENEAAIEQALQDAVSFEEDEALNMKMENLLLMIEEYRDEWLP